MTMTIFEISSVLIVLAAAFGWINHIVLRLPPTIGLVVMGLAASLGAMGLDWAIPGLTLVADLRAFVAGQDVGDIAQLPEAQQGGNEHDSGEGEPDRPVQLTPCALPAHPNSARRQRSPIQHRCSKQANRQQPAPKQHLITGIRLRIQYRNTHQDEIDEQHGQ